MRRQHAQGAADAARRFKVAEGFLGGQWQALKELPGHLRGGLGGAPSIPSGVGHLAENMEGPMVEMGELHRQRALGNIRTLLPSMALGGGILALQHHRAAKQHQAQQQAAAQQAMLMGGYDQPQMA